MRAGNFISLEPWVFSAVLQGLDEEIAGVLLFFLFLFLALILLTVIGTCVAVWLSLKVSKRDKALRSTWDFIGIVFSGLVGFALLGVGTLTFAPCLSDFSGFCTLIVLAPLLGMVILGAMGVILISNLRKHLSSRTQKP
jgi:hypothetical protein